jgi:ABC-type bacteriocin/lantibiotic exporter with double-glycine peptidase domain
LDSKCVVEDLFVLLKALSPATSSTADDRPLSSKGLFGFIFKVSAKHQLGLAVITTILFLISVFPLELQRRIVNDALARGNFERIAVLALTYLCVALAQGAIKLVMNIYRAWVSENVTRYLRYAVLDRTAQAGAAPRPPHIGIDASIVLSEAEPVGAFVGVCLSEPLLQCGILVSILSYMTYLQPWMAIIALCGIAPQIIYVPAFQNRVNHRASSRILTLRAVSGALNRGEAGPAVTYRQLRRLDHVFDLNMSIFKIKYFMNFLMNGSFHLSMAGVLALGGYYVAIGKIDIGSVIACAGGLARINDPWGDLVDWFRELRVTQAKFALIRAVEEWPTRPVSFASPWRWRRLGRERQSFASP